MRDSIPKVGKTVFPGILLISAATLLLEIGWMRVLSVTLWYHFAFMVLSTALFGFGFAGVVLSLRPEAKTVSARGLGFFAFFTPLAFAIGYGLSNGVPFEPFSLGRDAWQWLYLFLFYLATTLPFFFSGLTIAAMLTRYAHEVHRLYLFDLVGAGLGALLVVVLLPALGGSGTILFAAGLAGLGAVLIVFELGLKWRVGSFCIALLCLLLAPFGDDLMPVRISSNKVTGDGVPIAKVFKNSKFHRLTAWNTLSRVDVIEWRDQMRRIQRSILIDGGTAVTRLAHPGKAIHALTPGEDDESFFLRRFLAPSVLVVGSGGGREVLLALRNRASHVEAVEINPAINRIVTGDMAAFLGRLFENPKVKLFTDEARSFLSRSKERYDVIHCPHTISNAAMASGSLSLAENYLLTVEAFGDYMSHLRETGLVLITRPEAHLPRLFSTARAALEAQSKGPISSRVIAWRRPSPGLSFYAGFALRQVPFSKDEIQRFAALLKKQNLEPLYLPGMVSLEPYKSLAEGVELGKVPLSFSAILEPATDDKPFFNRRVPFSRIGWSDLKGVFTRGSLGRMALEDRPVTEAALLVLLLETVLITLLFIVVPLVIFRRRALKGSGQASTLIAFFSLGLAYITVEVGLIQRLTLYLGQPVVVFATVLGTLLLSSGIGSAVARRFKGRSAPGHAAAAAAFLGLVMSLILPVVIQATLSWSEPKRVGLAILFLILPGLVMGMPFPLLIRQLRESHPERIPWAFGINGLAAVVGTIFAVLVAMVGGQTAVLWAGVIFYGLAALAARKRSSV